MHKALVFLIVASAVVLSALAVSLVREFSIRSASVSDATSLPATAVVFTGQFDRIDLALHLFDQGHVERIFISGVNGKAGIAPQDFADQFRLSSIAQAALASGEIILAPDAKTTIENALETACWLDGQPDVGEIVLITGLSHMPRASWALERANTHSVLVRRLSPDLAHAKGAATRRTFPEMAKFGVTVLLTILPRHFWPADRPSKCM